MYQFLIPLLKAILPTVAGVGIAKATSHPNAPTTGTGTSTGTQGELEKMALGRVQASQPLYDAVMKMAAGRMPNAYRPGGSGQTVARPAVANAPVAKGLGAPDFAQEIVNQFRQRSAGMGGGMDLINPASGERRHAESTEAAALMDQGWIPAAQGGV